MFVRSCPNGLECTWPSIVKILAILSVLVLVLTCNMI